MTQEKISLDQATELWNEFKAADENFSFTEEQWKGIKDKNGLEIELDYPSTNHAFKVLARTARACNSAEEFKNFFENNEIPAIQLNNDEMKVMKGGLLGILLAYAMRRAYRNCHGGPK